MTKSKLMQLSFVAAVVVVSGCSKSSEEPMAAASQGDEASPQEQRGLSDGQIIQVLSTVDTGEIQQAQIALTKATTPQVRNFASDMIEQHTKSKQMGASIASQNSLALRPSPTSDKLQEKGTQMLEKLQKTDTRDFDTVYMKGQVDQHDEVLKMLDDKLIPAASSVQVKQQLTEARNMVQHHLTHAGQLRDTLGATGVQGATGMQEK